MKFTGFRPELPGPVRLAAFYALPAQEQRAYWRDLAAAVERERREVDLALPVLARVQLVDSGRAPATDVLACPVCTYTYLHRSGEPLTVPSDDYTAWNGRGEVFAIPIEGECGHAWSLCLGFHKGQTELFTSWGFSA